MTNPAGYWISEREVVAFQLPLHWKFAKATVFATDVSVQALDVARENALQLDAKVQFFTSDILRDQIPVGNLDVVVSNPPYIPLKEKESMNRNVLSNLSRILHFSLLDDDPLIFYRVLLKSRKWALT